MTDLERRDEIERCLRLLHPPGCVFEIRAPKVPSGDGKLMTISGYFDDYAAAVEAALELEGRRPEVPGIYVILNAIDPRLLERSSNKLTESVKLTTRDIHVQRRRWLPIDLDPVLPVDTAATDEQKRRVEERASALAAWMRDRGASEPVIATSGNGMWLFYPVDEPHDIATTALFKRVLQTLDRSFSDDAVKIDRTVCNAARIVRLFGTTNRKGNGQSPSRILQFPTNGRAR